ncbi:MAG: WD40 repeat domain-containing protein, partial [Gammaproteobacteria bacterium]
IRLCNIEENATNTLTLLRKLETHKAAVSMVVFSPDNKWLASCSYDKTACLYSINIETKEIVIESSRQVLEHSDVVRSVTFNANSEWLASGGNDKTITFWNVTMGQKGKEWKMTFSIKTGFNIYSLAYDAKEDLILSGGGDYSVRCYEQTRTQAKLSWTSSQYVLCVDRANISSAKISTDNDELLIQRGAIKSTLQITETPDSIQEDVTGTNTAAGVTVSEYRDANEKNKSDDNKPSVFTPYLDSKKEKISSPKKIRDCCKNILKLGFCIRIRK